MRVEFRDDGGGFVRGRRAQADEAQRVGAEQRELVIALQLRERNFAEFVEEPPGDRPVAVPGQRDGGVDDGARIFLHEDLLLPP